MFNELLETKIHLNYSTIHFFQTTNVQFWFLCAVDQKELPFVFGTLNAHQPLIN